MEKYHLALIGHPVAHSLSPTLFRALFQLENLQGSYSLISSPKTPVLSTLFSHFELHAINVTAPHKQQFFNQLSYLTPRAEKLSAINIVALRDGQFVGHNSDVDGVLSMLQKREDLIHASPVVVLGAGGAAAAVVAALLEMDREPIILNRTPKRGEALAKQFGISFLESGARDRFPAQFALFSCLPSGAEIPLDIPWNRVAAIFDAAYANSPVKIFAEKLAIPYVDGREWLVGQAVAAYNYIFQRAFQFPAGVAAVSLQNTLPLRPYTLLSTPPHDNYSTETPIFAWGNTMRECAEIFATEGIHQLPMQSNV